MPVIDASSAARYDIAREDCLSRSAPVPYAPSRFLRLRNMSGVLLTRSPWPTGPARRQLQKDNGVPTGTPLCKSIRIMRYLRIRSLRARPAEKAGKRDAGISMGSPVCGFLPSRFFLFLIWKVPKPVICTLRPALSSDAMIPSLGIVLKIASTTTLESLSVSPVLRATFSTSSVLFTISPPSDSYGHFRQHLKNLSIKIIAFFP